MMDKPNIDTVRELLKTGWQHVDPDDGVDATLQALKDAGLAIVPREPTKEMIQANLLADVPAAVTGQVVAEWQAMITAWEQEHG